MSDGKLIIRKVWRSELQGVAIFLALCGLSIGLSHSIPWLVIRGDLFSLFGLTFYLDLPLVWLVPAAMYILLTVKVYDVVYTADARGIEARRGILSFHQTITRVRYEDVRSIETEQSLIARMLDIGDVEVGTAATGDVEIVLQGVSAPHEVQEFLQRERDRRHSGGVQRVGSVAAEPRKATAV